MRSLIFLVFYKLLYLQILIFQVIIVGDGAVGKSSMIQRYSKGFFTSEYKKTIGVDFLEKQVRYVKTCKHKKSFKNLHLNCKISR